MGNPERVVSVTLGLEAAAAARQPWSAEVCQESSAAPFGLDGPADEGTAPDTTSTAETRWRGIAGESAGISGTVGSVTGAGTAGGADVTGGAWAGAGGVDTGDATGAAGGGAPALGQSLRTVSCWTVARPVTLGAGSAGGDAACSSSVRELNHDASVRRTVGR